MPRGERGAGRGRPPRGGSLSRGEGALVDVEPLESLDVVQVEELVVVLRVGHEDELTAGGGDVARHGAHLGELGVNEGALGLGGVVHGLILPFPL